MNLDEFNHGVASQFVPPLPPPTHEDYEEHPAPPQSQFDEPRPEQPASPPMPPLPADAVDMKHHHNGDEARGRKRKTKWGDSSKRIHIGGIHAPLPANMNATQLLLYLVQSRLEEIDRKLRSGDVVPPERDRSPSPPPTYDGQGKRMNTRDLRYKKKLEDERNRIVQVISKYNPNYKAPVDMKRSGNGQAANSEKVWIPAQEFPHVNFIGLLIGPRGNELKKMERESGAKISIRGKGSLKEGRKQDVSTLQGADEELHAFVSADSEDKVALAVSIINKIIEEAVSLPEEENPLKKQQLKELALLNGTLREDQNEMCTNCGAMGHRKYDCTETRNFTASLVCRICGGGGHLARDCIHRNDAAFVESSHAKDQQMSTEYTAFMKSLSGNAPEVHPNAEPALSHIPKLGKPDEFPANAHAPQFASDSGGAPMSQASYYDYLVNYYGYDAATAAATAAYYANYTQQQQQTDAQPPMPPSS